MKVNLLTILCKPSVSATVTTLLVIIININGFINSDIEGVISRCRTLNVPEN